MGYHLLVTVGIWVDISNIAQSAGAVEYTNWRKTSSQWVSWYDTKQSDCEAPIMLKLWGNQNTQSLPSLSGPLWPRVAAPDKVISMGQIELNCVLMLTWIVWNRIIFWHCNSELMLNWIGWNKTVFWLWNCVHAKQVSWWP